MLLHDFHVLCRIEFSSVAAYDRFSCALRFDVLINIFRRAGLLSEASEKKTSFIILRLVYDVFLLSSLLFSFNKDQRKNIRFRSCGPRGRARLWDNLHCSARCIYKSYSRFFRFSPPGRAVFFFGSNCKPIISASSSSLPSPIDAHESHVAVINTRSEKERKRGRSDGLGKKKQNVISLVSKRLRWLSAGVQMSSWMAS